MVRVHGQFNVPATFSILSFIRAQIYRFQGLINYVPSKTFFSCHFADIVWYSKLYGLVKDAMHSEAKSVANCHKDLEFAFSAKMLQWESIWDGDVTGTELKAKPHDFRRWAPIVMDAGSNESSINLAPATAAAIPISFSFDVEKNLVSISLEL